MNRSKTPPLQLSDKPHYVTLRNPILLLGSAPSPIRPPCIVHTGRMIHTALDPMNGCGGHRIQEVKDPILSKNPTQSKTFLVERTIASEFLLLSV